MESILTSVKKMLGIAEDYKHFDADLIIHINSVFSVLTQMGVGPAEGFSIQDENTEWSDFMNDEPKINFVRSYMYLRVRMLFDPPLSSAVIESINNTISELEWRLNSEADYKDNIKDKEKIQNE